MKKGFHHSKETRAKMKIINRRNAERISATLMGHLVSEKTKAKISITKKGNTVLTEEVRTRISASLKGRITTNEHRKNLSLALLGKPLSEEHKRKCGLANLGNRLPKEAKAKISIRVKRQWQNPEFRDKRIKAIRLGMLIKPNKPETIIKNLLDTIYPEEFKFVGDGQVIIAGKNPDFINVNGKKKIIEMFGDYWHGEMARCYEETEEGRIKLFKQYGFDTLIIWESELKNLKSLTEKIIEFHQKARI